MRRTAWSACAHETVKIARESGSSAQQRLKEGLLMNLLVNGWGQVGLFGIIGSRWYHHLALMGKLLSQNF